MYCERMTARNYVRIIYATQFQSGRQLLISVRATEKEDGTAKRGTRHVTSIGSTWYKVKFVTETVHIVLKK
jgi:hypothetical protein